MFPRQLSPFLQLPTTPRRTRAGRARTPTLSTSANRSTPSSSPPDRPYPDYPLSIPPEKLEKAVTLFGAYLFADLTESNDKSQNVGTIGSSKARSHTTAASSANGHTATSISTTATGELVNFTSLLSVADNVAPANASAAVSYTGEKVKIKTRKPLSPKAKAKAELIRWLGACWVCRERRVPCPFEHHDISKLEEIYHKRSRASPSPSSLSSSTPNSSGILPPVGHSVTGGSQGLAYSLRGIDERPELLYNLDDELDTSELEPQLCAGPAVQQRPSVRTAEIHAPGPLEDDISATLSPQSIDPYATFIDEQHFPLGTFRHFVDDEGRPKGHFICTYLGGCNEHFKFTEELQNHFEDTHFAYSRIDPAHCYICSRCTSQNNNNHPGFNLPTEVCSTCGHQGGIELWILGQFIRSEDYQSYPPDQQAVGRISGEGFFRTYSNASTDTNLSMRRTGAGSDENFNQGMNQGMNQGSYHYQDRNIGPMYPEPSAGGYGQPQNNFQYQGDAFRVAYQLQMKLNLAQGCRKKTVGRLSHRKFIGLLLVILFAILFGLETFSWVIMEAHRMIPDPVITFQNHLPALGFLGMLSSSAMCWCLKHLAVRRVRREPGCKSKCPLDAIHRLTPLSAFQCKQIAPDTYAYGGEFS